MGRGDHTKCVKRPVRLSLRPGPGNMSMQGLVGSFETFLRVHNPKLVGRKGDGDGRP